MKRDSMQVHRVLQKTIMEMVNPIMSEHVRMKHSIRIS